MKPRWGNSEQARAALEGLREEIRQALAVEPLTVKELSVLLGVIPFTASIALYGRPDWFALVDGRWTLRQAPERGAA